MAAVVMVGRVMESFGLVGLDSSRGLGGSVGSRQQQGILTGGGSGYKWVRSAGGSGGLTWRGAAAWPLLALGSAEVDPVWYGSG